MPSIPAAIPPSPYRWPADKRAAVILSVDFDGPTPHLWSARAGRADLLGELEQRRFGPRQGIWRILGMLDRLGLRASFYVPGAIAEAHRSAVGSIIAAGHEIGLHGYMHEGLDELDAAATVETIERATAALVGVGATPPFGYRSPSWQMTPHAWGALRNAAVIYDSSLMGDDRPYWLDGMVEIPVQWALDDAIFYRYVPGTTRPPASPEAVTADWAWEIEAAREYGTLCVITIHPWLSGRAAPVMALERMLAGALAADDLWCGTAAELANHHRLGVRDAGGAELRPGQV